MEDKINPILEKFSNGIQTATEKRLKNHGDYLDVWKLSLDEAVKAICNEIWAARLDELRWAHGLQWLNDTDGSLRKLSERLAGVGAAATHPKESITKKGVEDE